jgi:hypothetical protein
MAKRGKPHLKKILVYGSLYMDASESYEYAETQIDECIRTAKIPLESIRVAFDIIATPTQIASGLAREWGRHILNYCDKEYPGLNARVVGITDDDKRRVMRDVLITRSMSGNEIDNIHLIEME